MILRNTVTKANRGGRDPLDLHRTVDMLTVEASMPGSEVVEQPIAHHIRQNRIIRRQAQVSERQFP